MSQRQSGCVWSAALFSLSLRPPIHFDLLEQLLQNITLAVVPVVIDGIPHEIWHLIKIMRQHYDDLFFGPARLRPHSPPNQSWSAGLSIRLIARN